MHIKTEIKKETGYISLDEFLSLLVKEEDYFIGCETDTKLTATRLRKIFYDKYGWDTELIRKAKHIKGRYDVELVSVDNSDEYAKKKFQKRKIYALRRHIITDHKIRKVTIRKDDRLLSEFAGQEAEIYKDGHQEVILPDGNLCDIGHVLTGIDAYDYLSPVSPLPNFLIFAYRVLPYVEKNTDVATWLGDIASASGEFLFAILQRKWEILDKQKRGEDVKMLLQRYAPHYPIHNNKKVRWKVLKRYICLTDSEKQKIIDEFAPGQDMLGNIDSYVLYKAFNTKTNEGFRVSKVLHEYYCCNGVKDDLLKNRYRNFCDEIGLGRLENGKFKNEKKWFKKYYKQLIYCTAMYIYTRSHKPAGIWLTMSICMGAYKRFMDYKILLELFLDELKYRLNLERNQNELKRA